MTKQEQIDEMAKYICNVCEMGNGFTGNCSEGGTDFYKRCTLTQETAKALYNAIYRKIDKDGVVISREEHEMLANKYKNLEIKYSNLCDKYRLCKDANETLKQNVITARKETAEAIYNTGHCKVDEFEKCKKCTAWSGTDCTRNPYTEGCLDETVNLKNEIKRLEKENACLLKSCEEKFTFNTTQNKKYSVFNTVRKEFADNVTTKLFDIFGKTICSDLDTEDITEKIYESLKEYENDKRRD